MSEDTDYVKQVDPAVLVQRYAKHLKKVGDIDQPAWAIYVKTSHAKELEPQDPDWFYVRCASVARKLFLNPNHGLTWLAKSYSARKNRGSKPEHVFRGSRSVIRACLKRLEATGLVRCSKRRGRALTEKGRKELNQIAETIVQDSR